MKRTNQILSLLLAIVMVVCMLPVSAFAAADPDTGLCEHHQTHEGCGYAEGSPAVECAHGEHSDGCYEVKCNHACSESCELVEGVCTVVCTKEEACLTKTLICGHGEDGSCCAKEEVAIQPCTYECSICPVQALIDELPDADTLTTDDKTAMDARMQTISDAIGTLTPEQQGLLNLTGYYAVASALENLPEDAYKPTAAVDTLETPTNIQYDGSTFTVSWDEVDGATGYNVNVLNFFDISVYSDSVSTNFLNLTTIPLMNGYYTIEVSAYNNTGTTSEPGKTASSVNYQNPELKCTLTYNYMLENTQPSSLTYNKNGTITVGECSESVSGKVFKEWNTAEDGSGTAYRPGDTFTITENMTLYAQWVDAMTVTFHLNGHGDSTTQTVGQGCKVTKPADPASVGYTFEGWYKEAGCTNAWNFETDTVSENVTIYAKWNSAEYNILASRNYINFGSVWEDYNLDVILSKDNGTFAYFTITNYGSESTTLTYNSNSGVFSISRVTTDDFTLAPGESLTLQVQPSRGLGTGTYRGTFTITGSGGESVTINTSFVVYLMQFCSVTTNTAEGGTVSLKNGNGLGFYPGTEVFFDVTVNEGYYLKSLTTEPAGLLADTQTRVFVMPKSNVTITPVFAQPVVTFDMNGKDGTPPESQKVAVGGTATKPNDPSAAGYAFEGWYADAECTTAWDFDSTINRDTTLYAKWVSDSTQHTHSYDLLKYDADNHWYECSCGEKSNVTTHSGGTATCTKKAKCEVCKEEYGDFGEHDWDTDWTTNGDKHWHKCLNTGCTEIKDDNPHSGGTATCKDKAKCEFCDVAYGDTDGDNHSYSVALTWTDDEHFYECSRCSAKKDRALHDFTDDCDKTCNTCGYERTISHTFNKLEKDSDGHWYICSVCGVEAPEGKDAHSGGTATCTEKAKCEVCETEYGKLGTHGETEIRNAKPASCKEPGYTGDTYCKTCDEKTADGTVIDALGHGETEIKDAKDATCTADGYTGDTYCTMCGEKIANGTKINALGHGETEVKDAKDATCTEEGYTGDKHCKVCGELLESGKDVAKTEHTYKNGKCTVCKKADPNYDPDVPQTGDNSHTGLWLIMMLVGGLGFVATAIYGRKRRTY